MDVLESSQPTTDAWHRLLQDRCAADGELALYAPLLVKPTGNDGCFVLGRIVQSLDGRIATSNGASFWIGGPDDILHTHRLRALFDVVLVGAGTVRADNPLLTTRACSGPSPVRVVLDPEGRLSPDRRLFTDGPPTLVFVADDIMSAQAHGHGEVVQVPRGSGGTGLDLGSVLRSLSARGLHRIFVEGGGVTVSRFLQAGLLDRLHVTVAPLILGSGIAAFTLANITAPQDGLKLGWTVHHLGADLLLDIAIDRAHPHAWP